VEASELECILNEFQQEGCLQIQQESVVLQETQEHDEQWQVSQKIKKSVSTFNHLLEFSLNLDAFVNELDDKK